MSLFVQTKKLKFYISEPVNKTIELSVEKSIITYGVKRMIADKLGQPVQSIKLFKDGVIMQNIEPFPVTDGDDSVSFTVEVVPGKSQGKMNLNTPSQDEINDKIQYIQNMGVPQETAAAALENEKYDTEKTIARVLSPVPTITLAPIKAEEVPLIDPRQKIQFNLIDDSMDEVIEKVKKLYKEKGGMLSKPQSDKESEDEDEIPKSKAKKSKQKTTRKAKAEKTAEEDEKPKKPRQKISIAGKKKVVVKKEAKIEVKSENETNEPESKNGQKAKRMATAKLEKVTKKQPIVLELSSDSSSSKSDSESGYSSSSSSEDESSQLSEFIEDDDNSAPKATNAMKNLLTTYNSKIPSDKVINMETVVKQFLFRHHNWSDIMKDFESFSEGYLKFLLYYILKEICSIKDGFSAIENRIILEKESEGVNVEEISNILYLRSVDSIKEQLKKIYNVLESNDSSLFHFTSYLSKFEQFAKGYNDKGVPFSLVYAIAKFNRKDAEFMSIDTVKSTLDDRLGAKSWSREDDVKLCQLYDKYYKEPNCFEIIMKYFPYRTIQSIKPRLFNLAKGLSRGKIIFGYTPGKGINDMVKAELKGDQELLKKYAPMRVSMSIYFSKEQDQQLLDFWQANHEKSDFYERLFKKFSDTKPETLLERLHTLYRQFKFNIRQRNELKLPKDFVKIIDDKSWRYSVFGFRPLPYMIDACKLIRKWNETGGDIDKTAEDFPGFSKGYLLYLLYQVMSNIEPHSIFIASWEPKDYWFVVELRQFGGPTEALEEAVNREAKIINSKIDKSLAALKTNYTIKEFTEIFPELDMTGATYNENGIPSYLIDAINELKKIYQDEFTAEKLEKSQGKSRRDQESWTTEEDQKLLDLYAKYYNFERKIALMFHHFPNRSIHSLRSRPPKLLFLIEHNERPDLVLPEVLKEHLDGKESKKAEEVQIIADLKPLPKTAVHAFKMAKNFLDNDYDIQKVRDEKYSEFQTGYLLYLVYHIVNYLDQDSKNPENTKWTEDNVRILFEKRFAGLTFPMISKILNVFGKQCATKFGMIKRRIKNSALLPEVADRYQNTEIDLDNAKYDANGVPDYLDRMLGEFLEEFKSLSVRKQRLIRRKWKPSNRGKKAKSGQKEEDSDYSE